MLFTNLDKICLLHWHRLLYFGVVLVAAVKSVLKHSSGKS